VPHHAFRHQKELILFSFKSLFGLNLKVVKIVYFKIY
jgi:hypothetical protein